MEVLFLLLVLLSRAVGDERGVSTTRYAVVAALIALVAMAAAVLLGVELNDRLGR